MQKIIDEDIELIRQNQVALINLMGALYKEIVGKKPLIWMHTVHSTHCIEPQIELAERLTKFSGMDKAFFTNSGSEAVEGSIKLARRLAYNKGEKERTIIVSMSNSFHGRSYGALTLTSQMKYQEGFGPMLPDVKYIPFNDIEALN